MTGHHKDNIFVLTPFHDGPRGPILARKSAFFYATSIYYITPIFSSPTDNKSPIS